MTVKTKLFTIILLATVSITGSTAQPSIPTNDGSFMTKDSAAFTASYASAERQLDKSPVVKQFQSGGLGAQSSQHYEQILREIQAKRPIPGVSIGTTSISYDVIIQPGHYGRTTGRLGTHGALVSEQELVSYLVREIAPRLQAAGLRTLVVPADGSPGGLKAKVFLSIHADGSTVPCSTGPSLAYEQTGSLLPMHTIGYGLARAYGYTYNQFRKDNFTVDEAHYYMFGKVNASVFKGLLEVGELTCPRAEERIISSSDAISNNIAAALVYITQAESG